MNIQRFFGIAVALSLVLVAIFTARLGIATSDVVASGRDLSDYALRHPSAVVPFSTTNLDDYALRHRAESSPLLQRDLSDYALRHPNARISAESIPDLSDYALRHPEMAHPAAQDLSDYYLRHRDEFNNK